MEDEGQTIEPGLKGLFDFIGGKTRPGLFAVQDVKLTADPSKVQEAAQHQWALKNQPGPSDDLTAAYLRRARDSIPCIAPPADVDAAVTVNELRKALRSTTHGDL